KEVNRFVAPSGVSGLSFAPDGKTFLASYGIKQIKHQVKPNNTWFMEWIRDDQTNCGVIRWDLGTGQELNRYITHAEAVTCVAFLPDGKRAVSGGFDRALCLFDVESG